MLDSAVAKYRLLDFVELLFGFSALGALGLGIYELAQASGYSTLGYWVVVLSGVLLATLLKLFKLRKVAEMRLKVFSKWFHAFTDTLRNGYYHLMRLDGGGDLTAAMVVEAARETCQTAVDLVSTLLSESTDETVCVSIKYFPPQPDGTPGPEAPDDHVLATLVRSRNSDPARVGHNLMRVGDNTGFRLLVTYQYNQIWAENLESMGEEMKREGLGPFLTTNPNWRSFYRSFITVPIRINRTLLRAERAGVGYHILGLLCADTLSTSAWRGDELPAYSNLLKAFADALYIYLEKVDYSLTKLSRSEGQTPNA